MDRLILLASTALSLYAGSISGVVVDPSGASIQNSKLILWSESGGRLEAKSDQEGRFLFADLTPGNYSIEVSSRGFKDRKIAGLHVASGELRVPAIELSVAAIQGCEFSPVGVYSPIRSGRSELSGIVTIGQKDRAAGVAIALYDPKKNAALGSTRTDSEGHFLLTGLQPGIYDLRLRLLGFADMIVEKVEIRNGFRSETSGLFLTPCTKPAGCPAVTWASLLLCL